MVWTYVYINNWQILFYGYSGCEEMVGMGILVVTVDVWAECTCNQWIPWEKLGACKILVMELEKDYICVCEKIIYAHHLVHSA